MLVKEFRVVLPITQSEYQVGQLYSVAESSKAETGGGEGVEVLVNEPYSDETGTGQFTHKIYHLSTKVPALIRVLAPTGALEVHEKAWNAYPYCKTVLTNAYMKDKFTYSIETQHVDKDRGQLENAVKLSNDELKKREIIFIDIANDPLDNPKDYKAEEDPKLFKSEKSGRGPLTDPNWRNTCEPVMTCYKVVRIEFKWFGLQTKVESFIAKIVQNLFLKFHRQLFCWIDRWYGMTMEDIRELEKKTKDELDQKRHTEATAPNEGDNNSERKAPSAHNVPVGESQNPQHVRSMTSNN